MLLPGWADQAAQTVKAPGSVPAPAGAAAAAAVRQQRGQRGLQLMRQQKTVQQQCCK
jgi:hypothetical protein